ncbi:MAG: hypothetical protein AB7E42_00085 [Anaerotignaceae bacterium]
MGTKIKTVQGVTFDGANLKAASIDVRITSDSKGKTLSFTADNKIQIAVALRI